MPTAPADRLSHDPITHPLEQLRGTIRRFVLIDGLLTAGLFVLLWFWAGLAADYGVFKLTHFDWVLDAPKAVRAVTLVVLVALLAGILVTRLVYRLNKQFSHPALALVLEKRFPAVLGDRLITAVELADVIEQEKYGYSGEMIRATIDEARERVARVPVDTVFNWRRLRVKGWMLGALAVGTLGVCCAATLAVAGGSVRSFFQRFGDVTAIWAERNLVLLDTPWPRRAHLELVGFPGDELRVGKDAAAPKVRVRAFRWVIADRNVSDGWRPLLWADAQRLVGGPAQTPPAGTAADWDVDRVEAAAGSAEPVRAVLAKLDALAAKSRMSRTLRKLDVPDGVNLTYAGPRTRGGLSLTREPNNEFAGEVSGLKESVRFVVKGADYATAPRTITLVPPPMFASLARVEYQPAYLFHPPPVKDGIDPEVRDYATLKGLRQLLGEKDEAGGVRGEKRLSLTGDKSVFAVVRGTEFVLNGVADKPLSQVLVRPKIGKVPGVAAGSAGPLALTPTDSGAEPNERRTAFTLAFRGADQPTQNIEFEVVLVDDDGVTSSRTILVQVVEDQPPQVELAVDVLRKQGNAFIVTPVVRVPFLTESKVRDDHALGKVEFVYSYTQVEATVVVGVQAQALAGVWAGAPVVTALPAALVPLTSATLTQLMTRPEQRQTATVEVPKFGDDVRALARDTAAGLARKLAVPTDPEAAKVVREVKFNNQDLDAFDLGKAVPSLLMKDAGQIQPRYKLDINLVATDANVETGPKTGQNLEPIRLLVVSEAELLAEISKDEEAQAAKLDDVLKRLRDAQGKLSQTAERLSGSAPPPDVVQSSAVRALDIAQDVAKARDLSAGVLTEFRRLYREAYFNQIQEQTLTRYQREIIAPLDAILSKAFPDAEEAHKPFQSALAGGLKPDDGVVQADRSALAELIRQVSLLRDKLGEAVSLNKIRDNLRKLIDDQRQIGLVLSLLQKRLVEELYAPEIKPVAVVELAKGQKLLVKHSIDWKAFAGSDFKVAFDGPKAGVLAVPAEIRVADDKDVVEYEVTAGSVAGEYVLRLVPSVGKVVEVRVRVK